MARRGMTGQLNMFDFFHSLDNGAQGEVEMVSLVPEFDDEQEIVSDPEIKTEASEVEEIASQLDVEIKEEVVSELEVEMKEEVISELEVETKEETVSELEAEEEEEIVPEPETETEEEKTARVEMEKVAMSRRYEIAGEKIEIAYINYNKVRIIQGSKMPIIKEFPSSKEAVDFYVEKMQEYENEKG